jgi:hypothetical protein
MRASPADHGIHSALAVAMTRAGAMSRPRQVRTGAPSPGSSPGRRHFPTNSDYRSAFRAHAADARVRVMAGQEQTVSLLHTAAEHRSGRERRRYLRLGIIAG